MFRRSGTFFVISLIVLCSFFSAQTSMKTASAAGKIMASGAAPNLNEGTNQQYEIKLTQPIICPTLPDGEVCQVIIKFSSSDPSRISFSAPQVSYLSSEWAQSRYVTISTTRDFIYTPDLAQTIYLTASGTAPYYTNSISTTALTINNLDNTVITGSSDFTGTRDDAIPVNDLNISGDANSNVNLNLNVPTGSLKFNNTSGLTFSGPSSGKSLSFSGTRNNINAALSTLAFTPEETADITLQVSIDGLANSVYNPLNRHLYQIGNTGTYPTWNEARTSALNETFQNTNGYLANITSQQEQDTIQQLGIGGWIGGSDSGAEGDWLWDGGSESGSSFWNGGVSGTAVLSSYTNWAIGMPDDFTGSNSDGEDCLQFYDHDGKWNDQNCEAQQFPNFIIEYGAAVEPITLNYKDVTIHVTEGRDLNNDDIEDANQPHVANIESLSGKWIAIEANDLYDCILSDISLVNEGSLAARDIEYDYSDGLINFTGSCDSPQSTTDIRIFYYDTTLDDVLLRKYNPNTEDYATLSNVDFEETTIDDHNVVIATYQMSDGNELDTDGNPSNGQWTDPIGLAQIASSNTAPSPSSATSQTLSATGENQLNFGILIILLVSISSVTFIKLRKQST